MTKPFDELGWIKNFVNNEIDLNIASIDRIRNFVFLWNMFETLACNKKADYGSISKIVEEINSREPIQIDQFEDYLTYFSDRYFSPNGDRTYSIDRVFCQNSASDKRAKLQTENVLTKNNDNPIEMLQALLFILYRFRNNLFHGNKNIVTLDNQIDNFICANNVLRDVLEIMKRNHLVNQ